MGNAFLSFAFMMYLAVFKPFINKTTYRINLINELCMYVVSLLYITFTDFNPDAYAKVLMGWVVIFLVISNLIFPNGYVMVSGIWPDIKKVLCGQKDEGKKRTHSIRAFADSRRRLVKSNRRRFKLKPEFEDQEEFDLEQPLPKTNQVTPLEFYNIDENNVFFDKRAEDASEKRSVGVLP